jgi:hypothetical protein
LPHSNRFALGRGLQTLMMFLTAKSMKLAGSPEVWSFKLALDIVLMMALFTDF